MANFLLAFVATGAVANELGPSLQPQLGEPLEPSLVRPSIGPQGEGLPPGSGSVAAGEAIYRRACVACHGLDGQQAGNALAGGQGTLASTAAHRTVGSYWPYATTLFDYVRRAMPYGNEKSLSDAEVYAVVAYVLHLNNIVDANTTLNAQTLPQVQMPNRQGFSPAPNFAPYSATAEEGR